MNQDVRPVCTICTVIMYLSPTHGDLCNIICLRLTAISMFSVVWICPKLAAIYESWYLSLSPIGRHLRTVSTHYMSPLCVACRSPADSCCRMKLSSKIYSTYNREYYLCSHPTYLLKRLEFGLKKRTPSAYI